MTLDRSTQQDRAERWRRAVLVLAAHRAQGPAAGEEPVRRWARMLARRDLFADVRFGFVNGTPALADSVRAASGGPAYVVPFFMADGWFVRTAIPKALQGVDGRVRLCPPVGTSPRLVPIARRLALSACRMLAAAPADTAVLLVAHGTSRDRASSEAGRSLAEALAHDRRFAGTAAAFLDEPPSVAEALSTLPGKAVIAVGLFASAGAHGAEDVPRLLREAAGRRRVAHAGTIGERPGAIGAILERVMAADAAD